MRFPQLFAHMKKLVLIGVMTLVASPLCAVSEDIWTVYNEGFEKSEMPTDTVIAKAEQVIQGLSLYAEPKQKRKMLIYGITWGPHRRTIPTAAVVLEKLGQITGAYEPVVSLDLANFEPEALAQFDAVYFPCSTGDVFLRPVAKDAFKQLPKDEQKRQLDNAKRLGKNLADYVKNGGGYVGNHGAADCNKKIPEYVDLVGAFYAGHPWNGSSDVTINVERPEHGLIKDIFPGEKFKYADEIYEFRDFDPATTKVLMSINIAESEEPAKPLKSDYVPVSWLRQYGEGRSFYCSLGHGLNVWAEERFLKHTLAAIQYALGDYEVED